MPYDPRHVSEGGNRTTTRKDLKAKKGKYRIVMVDTFDGSDCVLSNHNDKDKAIKIAKSKGGTMNKVYVYDDKGNMVYSSGTF